MEDNESSKIDHLRSHLYSRKNTAPFDPSRSEIPTENLEVNQEWKSDEGADATFQSMHEAELKREKSHGSFFNKLFIAALIFFLLSLGVAAFIFYGGMNRISPNNVDISVLGPVSIAGGSELPLNIIVKNNNALDLENVSITVHYPDSTRSPENLTLPLTTDTEAVGEIKAGESAQRTVNAVFFGAKDTIQNITVTATYNIKGSTNSYTKDKQYQIAIQSSPIIMTVSYPKEVNSGGDTEFDLDITSNTNTVLNNVVLTAAYPSGFTFASSDPAPSTGTDVWQLGTLQPLEKRHIAVHGNLQAQDNEQRTFTFSAGTAAADEPSQIAVNLSTSTDTVTVKRPEVGLDVSFGNDVSSAPVTAPVRASIEWKNNLPVNLENAKIVATLSGPIIDKTSISANNNGFYKSLDNTVTWSASSLPTLREAPPGTDQDVEISFSLLKTTPELIKEIENPVVTLSVTMTGSRLDSGGVPQQVSSTVTQDLKVQTDIGIRQRLVYSVGPFKNTGPLPPKADTETTYTVIWDASNSFNNVSNARVVATLPPYVRWVGAVSPSTENISYDSVTNQVTWNIGDLARNTGYLTSPREVAFQIGVTPSVTMVDSTPIVVNQASITGTDDFTSASLSASTPAISTQLSTDPNENSSGKVGQ